MLLAITWMLIVISPAHAEVKVNPRGLCPVTYDIGSIHLIKEQINYSISSWRNDLVTCLPGQLGVIGGRPIFRASGESWEEAEKGCGSFQAGTLEIRNRKELLELSRILKDNGLSGIVTRAVILPNGITYHNHKTWDWLTPSDVKNIITPLLPAKYLGTPINKQVQLIRVSKAKEARRECEKSGGELISFDTRQHVEEIAKQLNISEFVVQLSYDKSTESLFWPNGKTFYLPDLETTIKGKEHLFEGMVKVNTTDLTYQLVTDPSSLPFICTLPYLVKEEIFSMTVSSHANISVGLSKVDSSLAPGVALLCRGKEDVLSKGLDELQKKVDLELLNMEEKDPSVQQLLEKLATNMEPRNPYPQPKGCWPHYIKPLKDFEPSKPTCLASLQDQEKNRRNFVKYLHQVAALQMDVQMATLRIEGASWVHLEVFSAGSLRAFLDNFGPNKRSVYLGSMMFLSCLGFFTTVGVIWKIFWKKCIKSRDFKWGCPWGQTNGCTGCWGPPRRHSHQDDERDNEGQLPLVAYPNRRMIR